MRNFKPQNQQGAVLIIALVMLLVLTVLAVSNMRGVTLESRVTGNRVETSRLQNLADAALREGEFRLIDPFNVGDKIEYVEANCSLSNKLNNSDFNKPCLVDTSKIDIDKYFIRPIAELGNATGGSEKLNWMPYRGLDSDKQFVPEDSPKSFWNTYYMYTTETDPGKIISGEGTHYFLVTGQADNEVAVQSTVRAVYLGVNH